MSCTRLPVRGTGEPLIRLLRTGNAGSNTAADHIAVLDEALAQLAAQVVAPTPRASGRSWCAPTPPEQPGPSPSTCTSRVRFSLGFRFRI